MNLFGMGTMEIAVIMIVALIIFGPGKLPEIGAQVGRAVRDFRRMTRDMTAEFNDSISDVQATVGEVKQTAASLQRETKDLAASIPAAVEGTAQRPTTAATAGVASATSPVIDPAASSASRPSTNGVDAPSATKDDPLADLGSLEDEIVADRH
jgi:TatA/E family protein of Tat protein translocase